MDVGQFPGVVALSSTEAKYIAETNATKKALWLQIFIKEVTRIEHQPLTIKCNKAQ